MYEATTRPREFSTANESVEEILEAYPSLTRDDVRAAMAYAAEMVRERHIDIPLSSGG